MIENIRFSNFKCLDSNSFCLKKINILTGYNGRGKSSLLQSILMLSQSIRKDKGSIDKLHLTGEFVYLGDFDEILSNNKNESIGFYFELDDPQCRKVELSYTLSEEDFKIGVISGCNINGEDYFDTVGKNDGNLANVTKKEFTKPIPQGLLNQFRYIHFISANRLGPVKYVEKREVPEFHHVGTDGYFTINTLATYKEKISQRMNINPEDKEEYTLQESTSKWMDHIMTGGNISVQGNSPKNKNTVLSLDFGILDEKRTFQSYNVGFGYSYILPIVVSALIAKKDSILIVENPEAHLHPMAQSGITELLSRLAEKGVQIFIETHSEHILNGFRLSALRDIPQITNEDLSVFFFNNDFTISPLRIQNNGRIPNWPIGFFDQQERDLAEIIRLGSTK
ncbi:hypothetical protein EZS27_022152 [termite gut metagenome]|uniref:DNA replication and repair protein RecF n=1 Tax=termite gut metagenome TaxID=433724 RepID=A0A5J4R5L0_9ZZZZ